jgi:N-acetylneuraminate synthase
MNNLYTIAEVGQAHDGSLGIAHSYIDALSKSGVDAIKFQVHIADSESSSYEKFRTNFSYEDKSRYDYWKRIEFSFDEWVGLKKHCDDLCIDFIATPSSIKAVDWLDTLKVKTFKVGSGDMGNLLLLDKLSRLNKEIILSSGLSSFEDIEKSILPFENKSLISILQCTTEYPTSPFTWGLNNIQTLKDRFEVKVGYSDHSGEIYSCLAAHSLGAEILEFHAVFDKKMFGPDSSSSLTLGEIERLIHGLRQINIAINHPIDKNIFNSDKDNVKKIFSKSLSVNKHLSIGHILSFNDLESKKPSGYGIDVNDYKSVIGKKLSNPKKQNDFLNHNDIL